MSAFAPSTTSRSLPVVLPIVLAALLVTTVWLRYGGLSSDSDTSTITRAARGVLEQKVIDPKGGVAYGNGFFYPVLVATTSDITGLSPQAVQSNVLPWLLVGMAVAAFVAFRRLAGNARAATIGALLLLIQPDFLFVTQRGSHEKVTWFFVLLLVFALVSSMQQSRTKLATPYIIVFYLAGFALICTNAFFGSSFIFSIFLVILGTTLVRRLLLRDSPARHLPHRLVYALLALGCFSFLFMFHIYPIAQQTLDNLDTTMERVAALYFSNVRIGTGDTKEANSEANAVTPSNESANSRERPTRVSPYTTIQRSWTSIEAYALLTAFTWILIAWAALAWFLTAARFFRGGVYHQELPLFIAWAFAAVIAVQIGLAVLADTTGSLSSNVQLRLFPAFTLFAVPMVVTAPTIRHRVFSASTLRWLPAAAGLSCFACLAMAVPLATMLVAPVMVAFALALRSLRPTGSLDWIPKALIVILFTGFALTALLKATNDPLVSNKWTFYDPEEYRGLSWANQNISPGLLVWTEFDERLATVARGYFDNTSTTLSQNRWVAGSWAGSEEVRYLLNSDITDARAARLGVPLPVSDQDDRIYDNGRVQLIHRVPETPYQP